MPSSNCLWIWMSVDTENSKSLFAKEISDGSREGPQKREM